MKKEQKFTFTLFILYLLLLTWIILFKMQFKLTDLPHIRSINLIPFSESVITNGKIDFDEILNNLIVFIPIGIYIGMLKPDWPFARKALIPLGLSLFYEVLQFIFGIGASDITDLLMNTLGGVTGLLILIPFTKLLGSRTCKVLNILAAVCTTLIIGFILLIILLNN